MSVGRREAGEGGRVRECVSLGFGENVMRGRREEVKVVSDDTAEE